ncbi:MAG: hypothetical protein HYS12_10810 [Planctomycetes bacterium]|nr:hypothetical protein [Planctomycetota bacterium]
MCSYRANGTDTRPAVAKALHDDSLFQRQIDAADRQIDQFVYELYGLTEEEINIVEAATP